MTSYLLAGPASEPISLALAKVFLRLDDASEDGFLTTLITAARLHVEGVTGTALIEQSWRVVRDAWPEDGVISLPVGPVMGLTSVTAYDAEGTGQTVPAEMFEIDATAGAPRLLLASGLASLPAPRARMGIEIDYRAGFGSGEAAVPADLKQALLALVAYWFEHRDAVVIAGSGSVVPSGFDRMVMPYRRVRL